MRRLLLVAVFATLPFLYTSDPTGILGAPAIAVAADEAPTAPNAPKAPDVDVNVNRTDKHVVSFANPTVIVIGAGALVLIVALIAMASRGGGTTIIKEK